MTLLSCSPTCQNSFDSRLQLLRRLFLSLLQEVERNLQDAMQVCRNVLVDPQLVPGGGASEMAVAHALTEKSKVMTGVEQWPYRAVAQALEVIPRTLIQNCGASTIRVLTSLRVRTAFDHPAVLVCLALLSLLYAGKVLVWSLCGEGWCGHCTENGRRERQIMCRR